MYFERYIFECLTSTHLILEDGADFVIQSIHCHLSTGQGDIDSQCSSRSHASAHRELQEQVALSATVARASARRLRRARRIDREAMRANRVGTPLDQRDLRQSRTESAAVVDGNGPSFGRHLCFGCHRWLSGFCV